MKETRFRKPLFLTNDTPQPNKNIRRQTSSNTTLIIRFFRLFRGGRTAHNGLVGGSSPPGPTTKKISYCFCFRIAIGAPTFSVGESIDVAGSFLTNIPAACRPRRARSALRV